MRKWSYDPLAIEASVGTQLQFILGATENRAFILEDLARTNRLPAQIEKQRIQDEKCLRIVCTSTSNINEPNRLRDKLIMDLHEMSKRDFNHKSVQDTLSWIVQGEDSRILSLIAPPREGQGENASLCAGLVASKQFKTKQNTVYVEEIKLLATDPKHRKKGYAK
jgi:hypothetical protein